MALLLVVIVNAQTKPLDKHNFDKKTNLKDDFYQHVNGGWLKANQIPDDRSSWGGFSILAKKTNADVLAILNKAIKSNKYGSETSEGKAINFYQTMMDTLQRNELGVKPIQKYLAKVKAIKSKEEVQTYLKEMIPLGGGGFFGMQIFQDIANSKVNAVYIMASPLGLPNNDYYIETTDNVKEVRKKYEAYLIKMLQYIDFSKEEATVKALSLIHI